MKIGDRVMTPEGAGIIVNKDLPNHDCWRWIVQFLDGWERCYFPSEVTEIKDNKEEDK